MTQSSLDDDGKESDMKGPNCDNSGPAGRPGWSKSKYIELRPGSARMA